MGRDICPTHDELHAYLVGALAEVEGEQLNDHLKDCASCRAEMATIDDADDTLIGRIRSPRAEEDFLQESGCQLAMVRALSAAAAAVGAEPASSAVLTGSQLGEYHLLDCVGRGGMGTVYRALHTKLGREVAIKLLHRSRWEDERTLKRFEREMQAIGRLDHPNIIAARDAREIEGVPVLVTEFVEGWDAGELARRLGPLAVAEACEVVRHTALALQYVHEHGLVHRDVKPSNIMISRRGEVKLLDLGLSRLQAESPANGKMTTAGQPMGTAEYIAPEQVTESGNVDIRADVYSLGCTLYRFLSGWAPFDQPEFASAFDKMAAHISRPVPPLDAFVLRVPDKLVALVDRMLAKSPDDRPATPGEVAGELETFCGGADLTRLVTDAESVEPHRADTPAMPAKDQPPKPTAAPRRVSLPLAVGLMLVSGIVGFVLGIVITINHPDGRKTSVEVADGSNVTIDSDGDIHVTPPGDSRDVRSDSRPTATARPSDYELLQGVWQVVSAFDSGRKALDAMQFLFTADGATRQLHIWENGEEELWGTYTVDPTRAPKTIDMHFAGSRVNRNLLGIYEFPSEGRLRICFSEEPARFGRPTQFASNPNSASDVLVELRLITRRVSHFRTRRLPDSTDEPARRRTSRDHLKEIALALHNYHDAHKSFPPAALVDPDGKPLLSWRVAILPFLRQGAALFEEFKLDEPWDSPHNLKLLDRMPDVFRAPGDDRDSTFTSYFAVVGPETVFSGKVDTRATGRPGAQGTRIREIKDGTSNTIQIVESKREVAWTQPIDMKYDAQQPLPEFGGVHKDGFFAAFADGSIRLLLFSTPERSIRAFLTIAGREPAR